MVRTGEMVALFKKSDPGDKEPEKWDDGAGEVGGDVDDGTGEVGGDGADGRNGCEVVASLAPSIPKNLLRRKRDDLGCAVLQHALKSVTVKTNAGS